MNPIVIYTTSVLLADFFEKTLDGAQDLEIHNDVEEMLRSVQSKAIERLYLDGRHLTSEVYRLLNDLTKLQPAPDFPVTLLIQPGLSGKTPAYESAFKGFDFLEKPLTAEGIRQHLISASKEPLRSRNMKSSPELSPPMMPAAPAAPPSRLPLPFSTGHPVQDYFVWDSAGQLDTNCSDRARQLEGAMSYSMQVSQRISAETGWGDLFEIHTFSPPLCSGFFTLEIRSANRTYGVILEGKTSLQDFIAATRARATTLR